MKWEGIGLRLRNQYIRMTAGLRRKKLHDPRFTVISNNCWAGLVYESYGLQKQSPTVGMYFMAEEYVKFVSDLPYYIQQCQLRFIPPENARHKTFYAQDKRFGTYPIARLGDVEIAMLHYHSEEEAAQKWNRRCQRICWDRMLVKMNDQNACTPEIADRFLSLPIKSKLFFTVRDTIDGEGVVRARDWGMGHIHGLQEPYGASGTCDINQIINKL